jgi:hypothetical protein
MVKEFRVYVQKCYQTVDVISQYKSITPKDGGQEGGKKWPITKNHPGGSKVKRRKLTARFKKFMTSG